MYAETLSIPMRGRLADACGRGRSETDGLLGKHVVADCGLAKPAGKGGDDGRQRRIPFILRGVLVLRKAPGSSPYGLKRWTAHGRRVSNR
ncbi:hypothetical protein ACFSL6_06705 [Paenibacillus thailandensis]|uniref:hypothetical protein n=1 Tax=Paenibacillus thailandensis TaxID=393250 RepID=UPI003631EA76